MKERSTDQLNFKCPKGVRDLMNRDIEETDEFRNQSEYVLAALRHFIDYRTNIIAERKKAFSEPPAETSVVSAHPKAIHDHLKS